VCSQLAPLPRSGCCPVRALVSGSKSMQAVYARCCGLDVHQKPVVAWVLVSEAEGEVRRQVRTVSTMTTDLLALNDGLTALPCPALPCPALPCPALGIAHVALESTGVYWRPRFTLLAADHELILVNAQHMQAVPGHQTDRQDAEWLADLVPHGLLRASCIPPAPICDLREVPRALAPDAVPCADSSGHSPP
jgi:transposase